METPIICQEQPPRLSLKDTQKLIDLLNDLMRRCPRVATQILCNTVTADPAEILSAYQYEPPIRTEGKDFPVTKTPTVQMFSGAQACQVNLAGLLSACVTGMNEIYLNFKEGRPEFELVRR